MRPWVLLLVVAPVGCYQASGLDEFALEEEDAGTPPTCEAPGEMTDPASGHCYRLVREGRSWSDAQRHCTDAGFQLVAPATLTERDVIMPVVVALNLALWIGATDAALEGTFTWVNGESFVYVPGTHPWVPGEPNNGGGLGDEDCVELQPNGLLNDRPCDASLPFMCERP